MSIASEYAARVNNPPKFFIDEDDVLASVGRHGELVINAKMLGSETALALAAWIIKTFSDTKIVCEICGPQEKVGDFGSRDSVLCLKCGEEIALKKPAVATFGEKEVGGNGS